MDRRFKQSRGFHESEEMTLVDQNIELRWAIPAVIPIFEIHPKPDTPLPVVNIDSPAIGRVIIREEDHQCAGELKPTNDLWVLGKLQ